RSLPVGSPAATHAWLPTTRTWPPVSKADLDPSLGKSILPADCPPGAASVGRAVGGEADVGAGDADAVSTFEGEGEKDGPGAGVHPATMAVMTSASTRVRTIRVYMVRDATPRAWPRERAECQVVVVAVRANVSSSIATNLRSSASSATSVFGSSRLRKFVSTTVSPTVSSPVVSTSTWR